MKIFLINCFLTLVLLTSSLSAGKACKDNDDKCPEYVANARDGKERYCNRNWPKSNCQASCGICEPAETCDPKYQKFEGHTACLPKSDNAKSVEITHVVKDTILRIHNDLRSNVYPKASNMLKMTWDDELEMLARRWADACEVRGGLRHDSRSKRFIPGGMTVGQNMGSGSLHFEELIESWWKEKDTYFYGVDYQEQKKIKWMSGFIIGHYTQMVWAKTNKIGCAATQCGDGSRVDDKIIVCNYGPAGNKIPFSEPYASDKGECGDCPNHRNGSLCDCGNKMCNGGELDPATCQCDCKINGLELEFMKGPECKLNCENTRDYFYCRRPGYRDCTNPEVIRGCPHMCNECP